MQIVVGYFLKIARHQQAVSPYYSGPDGTFLISANKTSLISDVINLFMSQDVINLFMSFYRPKWNIFDKRSHQAIHVILQGPKGTSLIRDVMLFMSILKALKEHP